MTCASFDPAAGYVVSLTSFVDCRVQELGQAGYLALAADGSPVRLALSGLITLLIALIGYRLLLGERLEIRHGVFTAARLGIVLALCTQWPAYQALVYDVVVGGPGELASALSASDADTPGELPQRIESSYRAMEALAHPRPSLALASPQVQAGAAVPIAAALSGLLTIEEQKRLSASSVALLVSSLGALLSVRVTAGLLLALGPLFAACLLFDGLRGWFEGWVRGLAGAALGSVGASAVLAIELAVLEPQLRELQAAIVAGPIRAGATTELYTTTLLFGLVAAVTLVLTIRAAAGFRLPEWSIKTGLASSLQEYGDRSSPAAALSESKHLPEQSRAREVADAVRMIENRSATGGRATTAAARLAVADARPETSSSGVVPLGRSYLRNQPLARSVAADRRNRTA
jgi:type IV secretion system protein VirB6